MADSLRMGRLMQRLTLLVAGALLFLNHNARAAEIWFGPQQPRPDVLARLHTDPTAQSEFVTELENAQTDWDRLFAPAVLEKLVPFINVYGISTGFVLSMPDEELATKLALLTARQVKLAFVAQPVIAPRQDCGHTEGYDDVRVLNAAVAKVKRLKLDITYLALDGGLFFGHYATGDHECRLTLEQTIAQVAITTRAFVAAYPDIVIGEIAPTVPLTQQPDWQDVFRSYKRGLETATGKKLDFLQLDVAWENSTWRQAVTEETSLARTLGMHIGYIYNGDNEDRSDEGWLAHARENISEAEGGLGLSPDQVIFASWNPHPAHSVGEAFAGTLASLASYYSQPGARILLTQKPDHLAGQLVDAQQRPLPGFTVRVAATPRFAVNDKLPELSLSGIVPPLARTAILGLRINTECLCSGDNDVVIGDITYQQDDHPRALSFLSDFQRLSRGHNPAAPRVQILPAETGDAARLTASQGQTLILNAAPFPVSAGAAFTFRAQVMNLLGSNMFGTITLIWLDASGHGLKRDNLLAKSQFRTIATIETGGQGEFSVPPSSDPAAILRMSVPDQRGYRGAIERIDQPITH
jgi:hypothetical protein